MKKAYTHRIPLYPWNELSTLIRFINYLVNIVAAMISFYFNKSFLWAIFHFIFGWIYMIYCLLLGRFADGKLIEILTSYF